MNQFLGREIKSLNLELTNKCYLQCSACARTGNSEITKNLLDFDPALIPQIFTEDFMRSLSKDFQVNLCGVYGDCIYHSQFHRVIKALKHLGLKLNLETNGSYKSKSWWDQTVQILSPNDLVTFSIDGLKDTNHIYRKNARWADIMEAIEVCAGKVKTEWKYIVFSHNEHQINEATELARKLRIDTFTLIKSGRFKVVDSLRPSNDWIGPETKTADFLSSLGEKRQNQDQTVSVLPKCLSGKNLGVSYDGHFYPCLTASTHNFPFLIDLKPRLNLKLNTLKEILAYPEWSELPHLWKCSTKSPAICLSYCGVQNEKFPLIPGQDTLSFFKSQSRMTVSLSAE